MDAASLRQVEAGLVGDRQAGKQAGPRLCMACVDLIEVTGAGIMLMVDDRHRGSLGSSDEVSGIVEELQFTLGEGPCIDAHRGRHPVLEGNLAKPSTSRWGAFSDAAVAAGVEAIFAFPLQVGAMSLGAMDLYVDQSGELRREQLSNALVMAGVIARELLTRQALAEPGGMAAGLEDTESLLLEVHQATGMLSEQLGIPIADALVRLRAYAYAEALRINDVAHAIVARRLRLE